MVWGGVWWRVWILPGWGETSCVVWGEEEMMITICLFLTCMPGMVLNAFCLV